LKDPVGGRIVRPSAIELTDRLSRQRLWDEEPVFCITTDLDWGCESAIEMLLGDLVSAGVTPTVFITHHSGIAEGLFNGGMIERGIHPNFLPGSSHGDSFEEVIQNCILLAPESEASRSHRAFTVTDISHRLVSLGFLFTSNIVTILQRSLRPILHESTLVEFPIFLEDGTHLFNSLDLDLDTLAKVLSSPGLKVINFHPMNYGVNPPALAYMRNIKDTLTRSDYLNMSSSELKRIRYSGRGIADFSRDLIAYIQKYRTYTLSELYQMAIS